MKQVKDLRKERRMRACLGAVMFGALLALVPATPSWAGSTLTIDDTIGDTVGHGGPEGTPAYLDIIRGGVTRKGGDFEFAMAMADPVPDRPILTNLQQIWWLWALDTDPTTFPSGHPLPPGQSSPPEFSVQVIWDGTQFTGRFVDRRPTLTGGEPAISPIHFDVRGGEISALVDAAMLGNPPSFGVRFLTACWKGSPGSEGFVLVDGFPNAGGFVGWPR